jgi:type IV pilus assembly protein PilW
MAKVGYRATMAGDQDGFTLVELLIAVVIGLLLVGSTVSLFTAGVRSEPRISERSAQIQEARTMAERLSRELRLGSNASSPNPSQLMILTYARRDTTLPHLLWLLDGGGLHPNRVRAEHDHAA